MSLVYITYHDENIFDVEKEKDSFIKREKVKYISKFRKMVKDEKQAKHVIDLPDRKKLVTSAIKNNHQTMGFAQTPLELPKNFLRKNNGIKWRRLNEHICPPKKEIPPVPRFARAKCSTSLKDDMDVVKKETCACIKNAREHAKRTNFVAINVNVMKNLQSKKPPPRYVDTPKGEKHNLLNSGLMPQYICSKNFAKVPTYLKARKKFLTKLSTKCGSAVLEKNKFKADAHPGMKKLSDDERQNILKGLKINLAELFRIYQGLSLYTDTVAKMVRKSKIENDLRQLEQDIYLIEHNLEIYVSEY